MKKVVVVAALLIALIATASSCSKCAVCRLAGQESNKMCPKDSRKMFNDSKKICENAGGEWVLL